MSNMSYCRFHNTALDLSDCVDTVEEMANGDSTDPVSSEEERHAKRLIEYALNLVLMLAEEGDFPVDELDRPNAAAQLGEVFAVLNSKVKELKECMAEEEDGQ